MSLYPTKLQPAGENSLLTVMLNVVLSEFTKMVLLVAAQMSLLRAVHPRCWRAAAEEGDCVSPR